MDSDIRKTLDVLGEDHRGMKKLLLGLLDSMSKRERLLHELDDETRDPQPHPGRTPEDTDGDHRQG
jgi:hypothetical protein